jgi:hypothetical protein
MVQQYGGIVEQTASTATSGGTTTLINTSPQIQVFTGSATQTVVLPDATTYTENGAKFEIYNESSLALAIQTHGGAGLTSVSSNSSVILRITSNGSSAGTWAIFNGNSALSNPMTSSGDMIAGGASGTPVRVIAASGAGDVPITGSGGTSVAFGSLPGNSTALKAPTVQTLYGTGVQTGWLFTISTSSTVAVGDTYTNNSNTFTVQYALSAQNGQVLFVSGTGATTGTVLARATGSGTASITFSTKVATASYTVPSSPAPLYIRIRAVGAGGGGGGVGSATFNTGTTGGSTFFANAILADGGNGGIGNFNTYGSVGGLGGGATFTASTGFTQIIALAGGAGGNGANTAGNNSLGGMGGSSVFGGAAQGIYNGVGQSGQPNTGGGGGGAGDGTTTNGSAGGGGGGGYLEAFASGLSGGSSIPYIIGGGGGGGSGSTNAGGGGGSGLIIIDEMYQ